MLRWKSNVCKTTRFDTEQRFAEMRVASRKSKSLSFKLIESLLLLCSTFRHKSHRRRTLALRHELIAIFKSHIPYWAWRSIHEYCSNSSMEQPTLFWICAVCGNTVRWANYVIYFLHSLTEDSCNLFLLGARPMKFTSYLRRIYALQTFVYF